MTRKPGIFPTQKLLAWGEALSDKEQRLVAISIFLFLALIFFFAAWNPVQNWVEASEKNYKTQLTKLEWMIAHQPDISHVAGRSALLPESLGQQPVSSLINEAAIAHNITIKNFIPKDSQSVNISIEDVSFNSLLSWLHSLYESNGIAISEASITRRSDPGFVDAQITLIQ